LTAIGTLELTVWFAGQDGTGFCVSWIVTVNIQFAVRFELSVAVQVTVVVPTLNVEPEAGAQTTGAAPQLSIAVGGVYVAVAEQAPAVAGSVMFVGHIPMTGFWLSTTVTVKLHGVAALPLTSMPVQLTVVTPNGNVEPEAGTQAAVAPGQLSIMVGV
jgi:hypothetical protein